MPPVVGVKRNETMTRCREGSLGLEVRGTLGAGEHGVGFVVVVEALVDGVPVEVARELHGDVMEEAGGAGAVADLDWSGGRLAGVDAFDPVGVLLGGGVEVDLVGADDGVEDLGVAGHKGLDLRGWRAVGGGGGHFIARHEDPALGAVPLDAVGEVAGDVHGDAVGVDGVGEELSVDVP